MNATSSSNPTDEDIISERLLFVMAVTIRVCVNSVLALSAFITNIINAMVFKRMGIGHSTESFFILSLTDCLMGFIGIFAGLSHGLRYLGPPYVARSMYSLYILFLVTVTVPSLTSMISTTVIAVVKCCSVAWPFRVRTIFTARRQRLFILFCTAASLAFLGYGLYGTRVVIRIHPQTNISYLAVAFHPNYLERIRYADFYRGIMFYVYFFTVGVCMVILIIALGRSYKFRNLAFKAGNDSDSQNAGKDPGNPQKSSVSTGFKLGSREAQVVKVVVLVSAVFTVCNLPVMIVSILRQAVPGLNNLGKLKRSFDFTLIVVEFFQLLNAAINIVVYLKFNSRYYAAFLELMRRGK